jgi:hypothetical protein
MFISKLLHRNYKTHKNLKMIKIIELMTMQCNLRHFSKYRLSSFPGKLRRLMKQEQEEGPVAQAQEAESGSRVWVQQQGLGLGLGTPASGGEAEEKEWIPITKLGHLVKDMKIKSLEKINLFSKSIKELHY